MPASSEQSPLLVVSASGRALAQSAARCGLQVVVLDLFNDMDVRALAVASRSVAARNGKFDARRLLAAAQAMCSPDWCSGLVYGSGFEGRTGLLAQLARGRTLFGNAPGTVAHLKDPAHFFRMLDAFGFAHPETRLDPPADVSGWLVKRTGGAGGSHVEPARSRHRARPGRYFQKLQSGRTLSVLFAADSRDARVIGINEQWTAGIAQCTPYCYGGAVSGIVLPESVQARVATLLSRLVRATGLVGLNGLDFILDADDEPYVLEINPRPTATIDLYDADFEGGLLALHLRACRGELPDMQRPDRSRAHAIVYATAPLRVPAGMNWPEWCTDIPESGSLIPAGAPICSVRAHAASSAQARDMAMVRRGMLNTVFSRKAA
ncbi:MAG: ATP-grasp domain-containing protein [Betaproteobacteria bacterium]|nr:ATP-grasp domain-containing protein [Betaproteobacteria bacterium]